MNLPIQCQPVLRNVSTAKILSLHEGVFPSSCFSCILPVAKAAKTCKKNGVTSHQCLEALTGICNADCCDCLPTSLQKYCTPICG